MRAVGAACKFRVELCAEHEGMIFELHDFCKPCLWPDAGKENAFLFEFFFEIFIEFVTMTVAFRDFFRFVRFGSERIGKKFTGIRTKAQGSPFTLCAMLIGEEMDDILAFWYFIFFIKFLACKFRVIQCGSCEFNNKKLTAKTESEEGNFFRSCVFCCGNFTFDTA